MITSYNMIHIHCPQKWLRTQQTKFLFFIFMKFFPISIRVVDNRKLNFHIKEAIFKRFFAFLGDFFAILGDFKRFSMIFGEFRPFLSDFRRLFRNFGRFWVICWRSQGILCDFWQFQAVSSDFNDF